MHSFRADCTTLSDTPGQPLWEHHRGEPGILSEEFAKLSSDPFNFPLKNHGKIVWLETTISPVGDNGRTRIQSFSMTSPGKKWLWSRPPASYETQQYAHALNRANKNLNLLYAITRHDILNQLTC